MAFFATINAFNAGELSPKMIGRSDISQYTRGCRILQNFMVTPYGAVERRPGTRFIARAKYDDKPIRLIRFVFSNDLAFVLEFGHFYIRFIRNARQLTDGNGQIIEISTPYSGEDLGELQFVQSADIMTIVHPDHPVMELKRIGDEEFSLGEKSFSYPPVLEPNLDDDLTVTPSGGIAKGDSVTLTASKEIFLPANENGYFQLVHTRQKNEISIDFTADGVSSTLEVFGFWTFTSHGTWSGTITIQRSFDHGTTWLDYRTYSSAKDSNTSTSGTEEQEDVLYRLKMEDYAASSTGTLKLCRCLLVNPDFQLTGIVRISDVESPTIAHGTVIRKIGEMEPTTEWNEGAWSHRRGFPHSVAFYEERMIFGGTSSRPQTVWGSKTNAWDNFLIGTKDDDAIEFTIASDTVNTIAWLCQHDALIIGTIDSEWTLSASDRTTALTPSNFMVRRQSVFGSAPIPASMVGETLLFVQRGNRKVREFVFQWEKEGYAAPDMTILADHITSPGIKETALQQLPDTIYWCILADGTVAALTYERDQEVVAWQKLTTRGRFFSIAVIPRGKNTDEDIIYFAAERNGKQIIEAMAERKWKSVEESVFLDSAIVAEGSGITVITNLDHLEGLAVAILADGAPLAERVVYDGQITIDYPAEKVIVGLPFDSLLSPMPVEMDTENGSSVLRKKAVGEVRMRVYSSVGGEIKCGMDDWQEIYARDVIADNMDAAIHPKTETVKLNMLSGFLDETDIQIRQTQPLPLNIASLTINCEVKN